MPTFALRFARENLIGISVKNMLFHLGLVFKHDSVDIPNKLIFWTFQSNQVLADLKKFMEAP